MASTLRKWMVLVLCVFQAGGCALWNKPSTIAKPPLTAEQAEWWAANQHKKTYIRGKGYYVEGTSGFFDHEGRRVSDDMVGASVAEPTGGLLGRLAPKSLMSSAKKAVGQGPNEQLARQCMAEGDALFRQKKYVEAADQYRKCYKRWPDSPLEEEAIFKAGESEFFADRYPKADDEYALLIKKFSSTQYLSQVIIRRFAIGRYWEQYDQAHPRFVLNPNLLDKTRPRFDTRGHALRVYEKIRLDDPIGPLADDAVMATANAYFLRGRWDDADYHYGLLRSEFPKSEHQFQAHLLGLRCKLLRYQGPGYEGAQLDESEELATQLLTQFSHELGQERDRVVQVRAEVRSQRALREWNMAEFYAKNKYNGAAKHYYAKLIDKFPDTKLAQEAKSKVDSLQGLPDNPDPPFEWLVDLLPASKKDGPIVPKGVLPASETPDSDAPAEIANEADGRTVR